MIKKDGEQVIKFEGGGEYMIEVDIQKNRISFDFCGSLDDFKKAPDYINHTKQAIDMVTPGYRLLSIVTTKKIPSFNWTTPFRESMQILKSKEPVKTAIVMDMVLHRMVLNVVSKLSGLNTQVFKNQEEALTWLDQVD